MSKLLKLLKITIQILKTKVFEMVYRSVDIAILLKLLLAHNPYIPCHRSFIYLTIQLPNLQNIKPKIN